MILFLNLNTLFTNFRTKTVFFRYITRESYVYSPLKN